MPNKAIHAFTSGVRDCHSVGFVELLGSRGRHRARRRQTENACVLAQNADVIKRQAVRLGERFVNGECVARELRVVRACAKQQRRKLNLKAKLGNGSSYFSFKR